MPVGAIIAFAGKILQLDKESDVGTTDLQHFGWKVCNGSALKIDEFSELYYAIGDLYGTPGKGQFLLPNYEGYFLRGVDLSGTTDPDRSDRKVPTATSSGGTAAGVGSSQPWALRDHKHLYQEPNMGTTPALPVGATAALQTTPPKIDTEGVTVEDGILPPNVSQKENRPVNMYVYWLIKSLPDY